MIRNITIGLLCGLSGVGAWATCELVGVTGWWSYITALVWSVGVAGASIYIFDLEDGQ